MLSGRFFSAYVSERDGEISDLETLQDHAESFLIANDVL
jgi:hypothetical protein